MLCVSVTRESHRDKTNPLDRCLLGTVTKKGSAPKLQPISIEDKKSYLRIAPKVALPCHIAPVGHDAIPFKQTLTLSGDESVRLPHYEPVA